MLSCQQLKKKSVVDISFSNCKVFSEKIFWKSRALNQPIKYSQFGACIWKFKFQINMRRSICHVAFSSAARLSFVLKIYKSCRSTSLNFASLIGTKEKFKLSFWVKFPSEHRVATKLTALLQRPGKSWTSLQSKPFQTRAFINQRCHRISPANAGFWALLKVRTVQGIYFSGAKVISWG